MTNETTGDWQQDVRALLAQGQKIEAIKLVRRQTSCGLKDAKEYVEGVQAGQTPAIPPPAAAKAGCAGVLVLMILAAGAIFVSIAG